jgi:hypothetical protein
MFKGCVWAIALYDISSDMHSKSTGGNFKFIYGGNSMLKIRKDKDKKY